MNRGQERGRISILDKTMNEYEWNGLGKILKRWENTTLKGFIPIETFVGKNWSFMGEFRTLEHGGTFKGNESKLRRIYRTEKPNEIEKHLETIRINSNE